jgi:DNA-directed RNA polymerase subunit F
LFHWKEETTHAMMDELEWPREDSKLSAEERDQAIDELIAIVVAVDGILQNQSKADVDYFLKLSNRSFTDDDLQRIKDGVLGAYRWQYIFSGFEHPRFQKLYQELINEDQRERISAALATLA